MIEWQIHLSATPQTLLDFHSDVRFLPCRNRNPPIDSTSICVRRKQSIAWAGVWTMGSFSLNEVFSSTGTPGHFVELANQLPI